MGGMSRRCLVTFGPWRRATAAITFRSAGPIAIEASTTMATEPESTCRTCERESVAGSFDLAVRQPDGGERHFFGLPAALCSWCGRFRVDAEALLLYGIEEADIASAIGSDRPLHHVTGA
jgi:hypothetical protein